MKSPRIHATECARCLLMEFSEVAVVAAAVQAVHGDLPDGIDQESPTYLRAVDAFWSLRTREGIPAVRDVLWALGLPTDHV